MTDSPRNNIWITLGTVGGPFQQVEGHQISNAMETAGALYLFDVGNGAIRQLVRSGRRIEDVRAVFVSHFHPDHIADLALVMVTRWLSRVQEPLTIVGPEGIQHFIDGVVDAYEPVVLASIYGDHGTKAFKDSIKVVEIRRGSGDLRQVFKDAEIQVEAVDVDHYRTPEPMTGQSPHAVGFRITTSARTIAYTGDCGVGDGYKLLAQDADLLVTEVVDLESVKERFRRLAIPPLVRERLEFNMQHNHIQPSEIMKAAADAGVASVLLTHFVPALTPQTRDAQVARLTQPWRDGADGPKVLVAADLGTY